MKPRGRDADELEKGLQAVQHAQRVGGFEVHLIGCNLQMIGLIFIDLLHGRARPVVLMKNSGLLSTASRHRGIPVSRERMFRKRCLARSRRGSW